MKDMVFIAMSASFGKINSQREPQRSRALWKTASCHAAEGPSADWSQRAQPVLHNLAKHVEEESVRFLNPSGRSARNNNLYLRNAMAGGAVAAEQGNGHHSARLCFLQCTANVFRIAARADCNQYVAGTTKSTDLAREHSVEAVIICDGSDEATSLREIDGRIGLAILNEPAGKLRREIRGVGSAATVAAGEKFVAARPSTLRSRQQHA